MRYREATADDVEAIAQLHADSWRRNYRGAFRDAFLDGPVVGERRTVWAERLTRPASSRYTVVAEQDANGRRLRAHHLRRRSDLGCARRQPARGPRPEAPRGRPSPDGGVRPGGRRTRERRGACTSGCSSRTPPRRRSTTRSAEDAWARGCRSRRVAGRRRRSGTPGPIRPRSSARPEALPPSDDPSERVLVSGRGVQPRRPLRARGGRTSASGSTSSATASAAPTARWRSGPTASPTTSPPRASGPATTSASTPTTRVEWVETLWAVFKLRAVWININYRYVEDELRYLFDNADLVALVYQREFAPRVAGVRRRAADAAPRHRDRGRQRRRPRPARRRRLRGRPGRRLARARLRAPLPRRPLHPLHRRHDGHAQGRRLAARGRLHRARRRHRPRRPARRSTGPRTMVEKGLAQAPDRPSSRSRPLMHGATQWGVMGQAASIGNKIVLVAKFDARRVWQLVERRGRQLDHDHRRRHGPAAHRGARRSGATSTTCPRSSRSASTAAVFSPSVKDQFFERFPNLVLTDAIGSSEGGTNGHGRAARATPR